MNWWDSDNPSKLGPLGFDPESVGWSSKRVTTRAMSCGMEYMHIPDVPVVMSLLCIYFHRYSPVAYSTLSQPDRCFLDPVEPKRVINKDIVSRQTLDSLR